MNRVGIFGRAAAEAVDGFILSLISMLIIYWQVPEIFPLLESGKDSPEALEQILSVRLGFANVLLVVFSFLYTTCDIFFRATPGKMLFGYEIRTVDGYPPEYNELGLRWACKNTAYIAGMFQLTIGFPIIVLIASLAGLVFGLGCLMALGPSKQALHDKVCGTAVFKKPPEHTFLGFIPNPAKACIAAITPPIVIMGLLSQSSLFDTVTTHSGVQFQNISYDSSMTSSEFRDNGQIAGENDGDEAYEGKPFDDTVSHRPLPRPSLTLQDILDQLNQRPG